MIEPDATVTVLPRVDAEEACAPEGGWYVGRAGSSPAVVLCTVSCNEHVAAPERVVEVFLPCPEE